MTEAEWLTGTDPVPMLDFLRDRATDRKLRLFSCACARLLWEQLPPGDLRGAVEAGERLADGQASEEERLRFVDILYRMPTERSRQTGTNWFQSQPQASVSAYFAALQTVGRFGSGSLTTSIKWAQSSVLTGHQQPELLREVFGNPFRPTLFDSSWRSPTVGALASAMCESHSFERMPELAEGLEQAGCSEGELLAHCRAPGAHVRGCWVVDLVFGRE